MSYNGTYRIPDTPTTATITAGNTTVTVSLPFKGVSPQDGYGSGYYVTSITSSSFIINLANAQYGDAVFAVLRD